jgi:FixJ family two-component response regulator
MKCESTFAVAVVDDDASVRKALSRLLGSAGYRTVSYASGAEFLETLSSHVPDCLVLDVHMPQMSGIEMLWRLVASGPRLPVVVITADDDPGMRERALAAGAAAYLAKPFSEHLLLDAVAGAIRNLRRCANET